MGIKMEKKTLHIDTLYLSYNCDLSAYKEALEIIAEKKKLFYRDGRDYYDFGYARVGVLDWEICERSNNYPFRIEYNFEYLYQTDLLSNWQQIKLPFSNNYDMYLVNRLDYNCTIQTMNHDILQSIFVSKHFRKGSDYYGSDRVTETVNLGLRKTGKTFRFYNKSKELSDKKNFIKNDMMKQKFGNLDNLYTFEIELHRKYIIQRTSSQGRLSDFDFIIDLAKHLLGSIKYCENTESNLRLIRSKNYDKIDFQYLDEYVSNIEFVEVKKYEKSKLNMLVAVDNILEQFNEYDGEVLTPYELAEEIEKLHATMLVNHKKELRDVKIITKKHK
jgi:hypothetical protein